MASKHHDHMASSKHQSQSLCFYNLPLFYDDNLIPEIKIQDKVYAKEITLRSLIPYSPYVLELNDLLISKLLNHLVSLPLWQH